MSFAAVRFASVARQGASLSMGKRFSSNAQADPLRFLVIDGYAPAGREDLRNHGASEAGILYRV